MLYLYINFGNNNTVGRVVNFSVDGYHHYLVFNGYSKKEIIKRVKEKCREITKTKYFHTVIY